MANVHPEIKGVYIDAPKCQKRRKFSAEEISKYVLDNQHRLLIDIRQDSTLPRYIKRILHFIKYRALGKICSQQAPVNQKPLVQSSRCQKRRQRAALATQIIDPRNRNEENEEDGPAVVRLRDVIIKENPVVLSSEFVPLFMPKPYGRPFELEFRSTTQEDEHEITDDEPVVIRLRDMKIENNCYVPANQSPLYMPKHSSRLVKLEFKPIQSTAVQEIDIIPPSMSGNSINIEIQSPVLPIYSNKASDLLSRMKLMGYASLSIVGCLQTNIYGAPCLKSVVQENRFSDMSTFDQICAQLHIEAPYDYRFSKEYPVIPFPIDDTRYYKYHTTDAQCDSQLIAFTAQFKDYCTIPFIVSHLVNFRYNHRLMYVPDVLSGQYSKYDVSSCPPLMSEISEKIPYLPYTMENVSKYYDQFKPKFVPPQEEDKSDEDHEDRDPFAYYSSEDSEEPFDSDEFEY